jgi:hypothetical protein
VDGDGPAQRLHPVAQPDQSGALRRVGTTDAVVTDRQEQAVVSLLPGRGIWNGADPAEAIRQASDQGCCGVEVRGFEPLASSVRDLYRAFL